MDAMNINQAMPQNLFQILTKVSLDSLNTGDILRGRVQSLDNGMLLIKLLDNSSFTAAVPEGFSAEVGDAITLEIGERQNNQLTARIVNNESKIGNEINKEDVLASTIKSTLTSLGAAKPENLVLNVLELLKANPGLAADQASFLAANRLSHTPGMDEMLQKISEHEFSLHNNLQTLQEGIAEALLTMDRESAAQILTPVFVSQNADELLTQIRSLLSEHDPRLADSIMQNLKGLLTKALMEETSGQNGAGLINKEGFEALMKSAADGMEEAAHPLKSGKESLSISSQTRDELLKLLNKGLKEMHEKGERINKGERDESFFKEMKAALEKLFDKAFIKVEKGIAEDMDIGEKTRALKDIMELSQKVLNNSDKSFRDSNLPAFKEIDTAFKFFEQVTTYNSILQLPIKMNQENTTGELYVMKRKNGRRKIDTENFTLFLSLSTQSLGLVESFLNATNKRITISFRVEDENLVRLFKDGHRVLYDRLLEKGFTLVDMKCRLLGKDRAGILNADAKIEELFGTQTRVDLKI